MNTHTDRPVFLDLRKIRWPVMAFVSGLHRASGVLMVLLLPVLVYLFELSLRNEQGFQAVIDLMQSMPARVLGVLLVWLLAHHFFAGIRFLLLDVDLGMEKSEVRKTAWMVHAAAIIATLLVVGGML
ncbi:MAG: succinate dehydrogenase, cytochrome b556 subunit [Gammaproteobacteria bacterium]|nr:succinate dehydrogenase, cytochrome b556 subunit [Gammaproteobacteria bacterium]MCF6361842.1 succinate dehydrogenase, cytochrome b556 subunit [Gammaproteobacteria bacterium]